MSKMKNALNSLVMALGITLLPSTVFALAFINTSGFSILYPYSLLASHILILTIAAVVLMFFRISDKVKIILAIFMAPVVPLYLSIWVPAFRALIEGIYPDIDIFDAISRISKLIFFVYGVFAVTYISRNRLIKKSLIIMMVCSSAFLVAAAFVEKYIFPGLSKFLISHYGVPFEYAYSYLGNDISAHYGVISSSSVWGVCIYFPLTYLYSIAGIVNPNQFATIIGVLTPFVISPLFSRGRPFVVGALYYIVGGIYCFLVFWLVLNIGGSRGGAIALTWSIVALFIIIGDPKSAKFVLLMSFIVAVFLTIVGLGVNTKHGIGWLSGRPVAWRYAVKIFEDNILVGSGPGVYATLGPVVTKMSPWYSVHNEYLEFLAEYGLVGVIFVVFGIGFIVTFIKNRAIDNGDVFVKAGYTTLSFWLVHAALDYGASTPYVLFFVAVAVGLILSTGNRYSFNAQVVSARWSRGVLVINLIVLFVIGAGSVVYSKDFVLRKELAQVVSNNITSMKKYGYMDELEIESKLLDAEGFLRGHEGSLLLKEYYALGNFLLAFNGGVADEFLSHLITNRYHRDYPVPVSQPIFECEFMRIWQAMGGGHHDQVAVNDECGNK